MVNITVNGKAREVSGGLSVEQLLELFNLGHERVAVEHNRLILEHTDYAKTSLKDGDTLEIVRFVGGG